MDQRNILNEASLGRIFQHLDSGESWGLISASRHEQSPAERRRATQSMASDIRSMGYGFTHVKGGWKEKNVETGETVTVTEPSFFIPHITRDDLTSLAGKYRQEAAVFGEPSPEVRGADLHSPSRGPQILLLEPPNRVLEVIGPNNPQSFNPNKVSDVFTRVKGKSFTLGESVAVPLNKTASELRVGKEKESSNLKNMILKFVKRKGKSK